MKNSSLKGLNYLKSFWYTPMAEMFLLQHLSAVGFQNATKSSTTWCRYYGFTKFNTCLNEKMRPSWELDNAAQIYTWKTSFPIYTFIYNCDTSNIWDSSLRCSVSGSSNGAQSSGMWKVMSTENDNKRFIFWVIYICIFPMVKTKLTSGTTLA
jgi:hypothetical protein